MKSMTLIISLSVASLSSAVAANTDLTQLIESYQAGSSTLPDAKKGQQLWNKKFTGKAPYTERSCQTCHSSNLKQNGQHIRTKKIIKPLAPSVNNESLAKAKKVKKWLKRNCKWTLGRECSNQEKVNLLTFLKQQ